MLKRPTDKRPTRTKDKRSCSTEKIAFFSQKNVIRNKRIEETKNSVNTHL